MSGNQSNWEKITAICLSAIVLGTFIFYVFNPPPTADATLALIRFLAASCSGFAAFLISGELNLEGSIPGLRDKIRVKTAGGFAIFLVIFILFYYGIQPENNSPKNTELPFSTSLNSEKIEQKFDLSGTWSEPGGNIVLITQEGNKVILEMPYLEKMGINTTQNGIVKEYASEKYLAYFKASNPQLTSEYYLTDNGNRLEGTVSNQFGTLQSVLLRQY